MNIYFTASIAGKKQYIANYEAIIQYFQTRGHHVVADHILSASEDRINMSSREDRLAFHGQLEKWIKSADLMVAETSFPSISVGYEIWYALQVGRPVLILYSEGDPPSLLGQHKSEKMVCERYTRDTLPSILEQFLTYIQGKGEMRFTFFITPQIASYLETVAKREKLPKAVYLRKLIEWHMREQKELPIGI